MNLSQVPTLLSQTSQIRQLRIPIGIILYLTVCSFAVGILNYKYLQEYNSLMTYIKKYHPDVYEKVRSKPDIARVFYSKGYQRVTTLIELSKIIDTFDDPKLKRLLFRFIEFDRRFMILSSVFIVVMLLIGLFLGIYYLPMN